MIREEILWSDHGILGLGRKGEEEFGSRNFLELYPVFGSPPLFTVLHGRRELGFVDALTFLTKKEGPRFLLLGGRAWLVTDIDWQRRLAYVEPSEAQGRSRWHGDIRELEYAMSRAVRSVLVSDAQPDSWSRRTRERISGIRVEYSWLKHRASVLLIRLETGTEWWTFAGFRVNATLAGELSRRTASRIDSDDYALTFEPRIAVAEIEATISNLRTEDPGLMRPSFDEAAIEDLKFSECLPKNLAMEMLETRMKDDAGICSLFAEEVDVIFCGQRRPGE